MIDLAAGLVFKSPPLAQGIRLMKDQGLVLAISVSLKNQDFNSEILISMSESKVINSMNNIKNKISSNKIVALLGVACGALVGVAALNACDNTHMVNGHEIGCSEQGEYCALIIFAGGQLGTECFGADGGAE